MKHAIELQDVSQVYVGKRGAFLAVEHISLQVGQGEFVSLIGPSGCGKTTLLSLISGLMLPSAGTVKVGGELIEKPSPKVGYMLQQDYLFPWRTILENATLGLELMGRLNDRTKRFALELLEEMDLADQANRYPHQLSGGMRQRVALVRTLATEPEILLLDEPFSALDYQTKLQLEELVAETLRARGKTAVLVTHDITEAIAMSDRVAVLEPRPGRIRTIVDIPKQIQEAPPLEAREAEGFHALFRELWKQFTLMEAKGGVR
jgi:NitT/TauT family transport system ATP-binding protein